MGTNILRPRRPHRGRDRVERLQRMILRIHGALMLSFAAFTLLPLTSSSQLSSAEIALRLAIAVLDLAVIVDLQVRGERLLHTIALALPVALPALGLIEPRAGDITSALTLAAFALSASQVLTRAAFAACVLFAAAPFVLAGLMGEHSTKALDDSLVAAGMTFAAAVFVDTLTSAAVRAAEVDAAVARERAALQEEQAKIDAVAAAGRVLHDEVLAALRLLADRQGSRSLRAVCARAVKAVRELAEASSALPLGSGERSDPNSSVGFDEAGPVDPLDQLIETVTGEAPVTVSVRRSRVSGQLLSPVQLGALRRALGEALRNVARHSGQSHAELRVTQTNGVVVLEVVDRGRGLQAEHRAGYGLEHSVVAPIEDAGGSATLAETPGGGLTVALALPLPEPGGTDDRLRTAYDLAMRTAHGAGPIRAIAWPIALVWIYLAIRHSFSWPNPTSSLVLAVGYVLVTGGLINRLETGPLGVRALALLATALLALHGVGLMLAPDGALLDYRSWFVGWIALPVVLLVFVLPLPLSLPLVLSHTALVVVAFIVDPALSNGVVPWSAVNATVSAPLVAVAFGYLLRRLGQAIRDEEDQLARAVHARALLRSAEYVAATHLGHTRRVVVPWLESIATIGPGAEEVLPDVAEQARLFATEVRDDLYAPGFFDDALRHEVTQFRAAGGVVEVRPGSDTDGWTANVAQLVHRLIRALDPYHAIAVTPPRNDRPVRIVVTPPIELTGATTQLLAGLDVDTDEFRTIVNVP